MPSFRNAPSAYEPIQNRPDGSVISDQIARPGGTLASEIGAENLFSFHATSPRPSVPTQRPPSEFSASTVHRYDGSGASDANDVKMRGFKRSTPSLFDPTQMFPSRSS